MSGPKNKRKKYFVDRKVQGAILWHMVLHWGLLLAATFVLLVFFDMVTRLRGNVGTSLLQRHAPTLLAMLALAPICIRDLCKLSNRFAGPMVRLRRAMRDLAEGREVAPVHFRENDFWKDLAADFNRVVHRVEVATASPTGVSNDLDSTSHTEQSARRTENSPVTSNA